MKKRPKKIILSWLLALSLLLSLLPSAALAADTVDSGACGSGLTWTLDEDGVLTVSGTGEMDDYGTDDTPWYARHREITAVVIGDGVTGIGTYAFYNCTALTDVTISASVTSIGEYAFADCAALTNITLPNSVMVIGDYAFLNCVCLTEIDLPDSVTDLGDQAFRSCTALTSVSLSCDIPDYAFYGCTALTEASLGEGVTDIGEYAFCGCTALMNIILPDSVVNIEAYAFYNCTSLVLVSFGTGISWIKDYAFSVSNPDGVAVNNYDVKYVYYALSYDEWNEDGRMKFGDGNVVLYAGATTTYYYGQTHTHSYSEQPVFTLSDDGTSVTAVFTCDMGDSVQTVTGAVDSAEVLSAPSCTDDGETKYTVSCTFQGKKYSDTITQSVSAAGHSYEQEFSWGADYTSCTVELTCSVCGDVSGTQACTVRRSVTAATCTQNGQILYTARCTYGGATYTDTRTVDIEKIGHTYGEPTYIWEDDRSAACAVFTCSVCGESETVNGTVTAETTEATETEDGKTVYTAVFSFEDATYTDTRTVVLSATGETHTHTYGDPVFTWASDYSSATAAFTCSVCGETKTVDCAVTTSVQEAKCTSDGAIVYIGTAELDGEPYTDLRVVSLRTLGHDYTSAITLQPTRYTTGVRTYTCTRCGDVYTEEISVRTDATFLFDDVQNESSYYYQAVYWGYDLGVTTGTSATLFSPSKGCTRAQFVTFLYRMAAATGADTSVSNAGSTAFVDISSGASYYDAVLWAAEIGVTTGTSSTTFSPSRTITRREAVAMLYRYECAVNGEPTDSAYNLFYDVKTNDYAYAAILWAIGRGITTGTSSTTFSPGDTCTRAMMISFLYRYTTSGT